MASHVIAVMNLIVMPVDKRELFGTFLAVKLLLFHNMRALAKS